MSIFHVNNNSFRGPLIIGTFEKQAPGHLQGDNKAKELLVMWPFITSQIFFYGSRNKRKFFVFL